MNLKYKKMKNLKSIVALLAILLSVGVFAQKKTEKFEKLQIRWENENIKYKKLKLFFVWFYIILSFLIFLLTIGGNIPFVR